jgi:UDPglucose--hexose-1-phosphate uridylyltransferase
MAGVLFFNYGHPVDQGEQDLFDGTMEDFMTAITFEKTVSTFTIQNPFNNFAAEVHQVEVRKDPLLGDTSVYNPFLKDKAKAFFGENDMGLVEKLSEETAKNCIFCGENVLQKTARYPADVLSEGRVRSGSAVLFANLFSIGAYHPVIALGSRHFLRLSEFTAELLNDGFRAAGEFLRSLYRRDSSAVYSAICANYLVPAGASLVHPHQQMLVTPMAYSYHARMTDAADAWFRRSGRCYFDDLISEEKTRGERYAGRRGNWHWIAAFSPMGSNEITAIHEGEQDVCSLTETDVADLCRGITKALLLYEHLGLLPFNYALYSVRQGAGTAGGRCIFKIISRQNLYSNYRNDDYFLQKMLQTELIFNTPEELAERLRAIL